MEVCVRVLRTAFALCLILGVTCSAAFSAEKIGDVGAVEGTAEIMPKGESEFKPLKKNDPINLEDNVSTEEKSKVWLRLKDESHHSLGEDAQVMLNDFGEESGATFYHGHLRSGEARFIKKLPDTEPPSSYVITTPTAIVDVQVTEEAADFIVRVVNDQQTSVWVIWGKVKVKNILESIEEERIVKSCQGVVVNAGKKPSKVFGVSSDALKEAIERTTIPGTLPDEVPECEDWGCPCPWGMAKDVDGECKPCAFFAGAVYDPDTCSCVCPCPEGMFPHPYTGECDDWCPTQFPIPVNILGSPDPDFLPHEGCPSCACCPDYDGCFLGTPWDAGCVDPECGKCGPTPLVFPPLVLPPDPFGWYPCAKCCACDASFHIPGDPCGLNAAGFISGWPCGAGGKCISRSDCLAQGGFFVRTDYRFPYRPCWVCQRDWPIALFAKKSMSKSAQCPECSKLTFRKGKAECVPDPTKKDCYVDGKCGECKDGKCVELPKCPEGQIRNHKCECEKLQPPPKECESNSDCVKQTKGAKPCCQKNLCKELKRCPDGKRRCECEGKLPPPPPPTTGPPPGVVEECEKCGTLVDGKCVYPVCPEGRRLNRKTCRCEPTTKPECANDEECGRCEKCVRGDCRGPRCKEGQRLNYKTCRCEDVERPECRNNSDCGRCERCVDGDCVRRRCPAGQKLDPRTCDCVGGPAPECRNRADCDRCERCIEGRCVSKRCPRGTRLSLRTCECVGGDHVQCRRNGDCDRCDRCVHGRCVKRGCPRGQKLNRQTCQCEGRSIKEPGECRNNRDCGRGYVCRHGRCVKRPTQPGDRGPATQQPRRPPGTQFTPQQQTPWPRERPRRMREAPKDQQLQYQPNQQMRQVVPR